MKEFEDRESRATMSTNPQHTSHVSNEVKRESALNPDSSGPKPSISDGRRSDNDGPSIMDYLKWTPEDVKDFQAIWVRLKEVNPAEGLKFLGVAILLWILENLPEVKKLFSFETHYASHQHQLRDPHLADQRFMAHSLGIARELDMLIDSLDDPHLAYTFVENFIKIHMTRRVTARHMEVFRDQFHLLLYDLIRTGKNSRSSKLWYEFFDVFVKLYKEAEGHSMSPAVGKCCSCVLS